MGDGNVIDINDESAKLLAQIITNEKALAILHAIEEEPKSITQIAEELNFPLSTVSYHIERMLRVGLVELAGKKYGKKLQEVKLYRASNRPILIVPRRDATKVSKKLHTIERLHVISLGLAAFISTVVYAVSKRFLGAKPAGTLAITNTTNVTESYSVSENISKFVITGTNTTRPPAATTTPLHTVSNGTVSGVAQTHGSNWSSLPLYLAIITFIIVFLVAYWLLKRKSQNVFKSRE
ncbi:transcriptional regulator [Thermococcus profundus]|uniref:Transcriptional regulator n=1 Tax=Thermococcus profundus TaxID=49899 RepID=A0A2Z2MKQ3_THEPR|nr:winged helix-turn-helix domain-containing protein [Thermococcus profundus]ASJ02548.1 transcriptional regulator [Thermococcus profundus]